MMELKRGVQGDGFMKCITCCAALLKLGAGEQNRDIFF